jgi:hypothetical protein
MIRRTVCVIALLGLGSVPARPAEPAPQGQFDGLIKSSPFGQAAPAGGAAANGPASLEFRGVFLDVDKGEYFFSLHETGSRTGQWVGLKESGQPYVVDSYDAEKGAIQVKYRGQTLNLALKLAQVIVQAPPPPLPVNPGSAPIAVPAGSPAQGDEASRLAQVAEEIRRRRALRAPPASLPQAGPMVQPNAPNSSARPYTPPVRP